MYLSKQEFEPLCKLPDVVGFSTWMNVTCKTQSGLRYLVDVIP